MGNIVSKIMTLFKTHQNKIPELEDVSVTLHDSNVICTKSNVFLTLCKNNTSVNMKYLKSSKDFAQEGKCLVLFFSRIVLNSFYR